MSAGATAGGAGTKSSLSTHVLNTATGAPGKGVKVSLEVPEVPPPPPVFVGRALTAIVAL